MHGAEPQQCLSNNMLTQKTPLAIRPSVTTAFACRRKVRHQPQSTIVRARFDTNKGDQAVPMRLLGSNRKKTRLSTPHTLSATTGSDRSVLEAFFLGRAFAETINDRLGAALGDLLSEIAKADAERRQAWK
jgi:hypothetical protein